MASLIENSKSPEPKQLILPILLVCEDSDGAVSYLQDRISASHLTCAKVQGLHTNVTILGGKGQHDYLVKQAIKELDTNILVVQQGLELPYDTIYCIMDYDIVWHNPDLSKQNLLAAYQRIKEKNEALANEKIVTRLQHIVTNDCFELWYLLHFYTGEEIKAPLKPLYRSGVKNTDAGGKIGRELWGKLASNQSYSKDRYEKIVKNKTSPIYSLLKEKGGDEKQAIINAEKLITLHQETHETKNDFLLFLYNPSTEIHLLIKKLDEMEKKQQ